MAELDIGDIEICITPRSHEVSTTPPFCEGAVLHYYGDGEFDFISNSFTRCMLKNAHWAVTQCESWSWLHTFNEESFMFSTSPVLNTIMNKMIEQPEGQLHSGASFAYVMRAMEYIAKYGYAAYEKKMN